jgi:hypothetical protein
MILNRRQAGNWVYAIYLISCFFFEHRLPSEMAPPGSRHLCGQRHQQPLHEPPVIREAVLTPEPSMPNARPEAARPAVETAVNVNWIIAPDPGNFPVRIYFMTMILENRAVSAGFAMDGQTVGTSAELEQFKQTFRHAIEPSGP